MSKFISLSGLKTLLEPLVHLINKKAESWDDLKNKPFYEAKKEIALIDQEISSPTVNLSATLVEGETYTIIWDGIEYTSVARNYDGQLMVGNNALYEYDYDDSTDTGEPFALEVEEGTTNGYFYISEDDTSPTHTVKILGNKITVKKIDKKYLPDNLATKDYVDSNTPEISIDDSLNSWSSNPVENRVVNSAIANLNTRIDNTNTNINTLVGNTSVSTQIQNAVDGLASEEYVTAATEAVSSVKSYTPMTIENGSNNVLNSFKIYGTTSKSSTNGVRRLDGLGAVQVVTAGKNIIPNSATSQTKNGITYTVYSDGTIEVFGTATADSELIIAQNAIIPITGQYFLTGCPTSGSTTRYYLSLTRDSLTSNETGTGLVISNLTAGTKYTLKIVIKKGISISIPNVIFKPMLRFSTFTDATYEQYQGSAIELPAVNSNGLHGNISVSGNYNDAYLDNSGRYYIADSIEYDATTRTAEYIRRIGHISGSSLIKNISKENALWVIEMSEEMETPYIMSGGKVPAGKCSQYTVKELKSELSSSNGNIAVMQNKYIYLYDLSLTSADMVRAKFEETGFEITYPVYPVRTKLSFEYAQQISKLKTCLPTTYISNTAPASNPPLMEISYFVNTNIGNAIGGAYATPVTQSQTATLSVPTTGWTENTTYSSYTQVFTVNGATTSSDIYIDCPVGANFPLIGARCLAANKITLYMSSIPTLAQNISIKLKKG